MSQVSRYPKGVTEEGAKPLSWAWLGPIVTLEATVIVLAFVWDFGDNEIEGAAHAWAWITLGITVGVFLVTGFPWGRDGFETIYWEGAPLVEKLRISLIDPAIIAFPIAAVPVAATVYLLRIA